MPPTVMPPAVMPPAVLPPPATLNFDRIAAEYGRWRGVTTSKRCDAPGWWWGPALALRQEVAPMPPHIASPFALPANASYADAAMLILGAFAAQTRQPWPDDFPEKHSAKVEDLAASAEAAAQAASAAIVPIA